MEEEEKKSGCLRLEDRGVRSEKSRFDCERREAGMVARYEMPKQ